MSDRGGSEIVTGHESSPAPLRDAFAALSAHAKPGPDCPAPDRIWEAVRGELSPAQTKDVVDHISSCAACAEAWRLAEDVAKAAPIVAVPSAPLRRSGVLHRPILAAGIAAALVIAVGGVYLRQRATSSDQSIYRQPDAAISIQPLIDEQTALPRDRCVLRWSGGPSGTRYRVRVASEDMRLISLAQNLDVAEYQVPAGSLDALPAGARLLWQVEAVMPDGRRASSPTFFAVLQ